MLGTGGFILKGRSGPHDPQLLLSAHRGPSGESHSGREARRPRALRCLPCLSPASFSLAPGCGLHCPERWLLLGALARAALLVELLPPPKPCASGLRLSNPENPCASFLSDRDLGWVKWPPVATTTWPGTLNPGRTVLFLQTTPAHFPMTLFLRLHARIQGNQAKLSLASWGGTGITATSLELGAQVVSHSGLKFETHRATHVSIRILRCQQ